MFDEEIPRNLPERTGTHICARCLREIGIEEYLRGDFLCDSCAAAESRFPLASTPEVPEPDEPSGDRSSGEGRPASGETSR